jgi:adenosylmethionine---8-amino-7-oxononanoate aminotransferase
MNFVQRDKEVVWHPFTPQKGAEDPIHIERAEGVWLYASDGRKFIDGISSWWVNIHGHAHPYIAKKIAEQAAVLEQVIFAGFTHTPAIELSEKLISILPGNFSKVFYSDNGSTSVEVALKMALQCWHNKGERKTKIIAFGNAYHGDTFGAMSAGGRSLFTAPFQSLLFDVVHLPLPTHENFDACKQQLNELCADGDVAAFIFEPLVQGAAGMLMYEARHLDELIAVARRYEVACIADEVMTGFGRTGKLFACDHLQNKPDIICVSKAITGGFLPLGVTACNQKIFDAFDTTDRSKTFFHGHSYTANPISCAAAIASIELLLQSECLQQIEMIGRSHKRFVESMRDNSFVKNARCLGTIVALELNTGENSSYLNSVRDEIYHVCLEKGILLRPLGNIIYAMPPYCIDEEELDKIYEAMLCCIEIVKGKSEKVC